ncbi:MAG: patatin-like phospholipase family protein [Gammaproteobacteria bacterium]|nr:MAG: patatin-like phospholipase family protein [Gammaproteobacteria bacterium]
MTTPAVADEQKSAPSIGLALGSGGAGGLAHIAMLEVFEELSLRPAAISGSSIGAIMGALYAAGMDNAAIRELFIEFADSALNPFSDITELGEGASWTDLLELDNSGILDADGFLDFLGERIDAREFSDLEIPLQIVATDYWTGETVVLDEGDLFQAIKASMAVPGLFSPVEDGDRLLIDGGVSNPLPWDVFDDVDLVVAIDVTGVRQPSPDGSPGIAEMLFKSFEIMQQSIIARMSAAAPPDIYIKPALEDVRLLHFDRVDEVLAQAGTAADELRTGLQDSLAKGQ